MLMSPQNFLQKQLEEQRFLHGIAYVESAARGLKILSTSELAHLNRLLTGQVEGEPWRFVQVSVRIPSGKTHHFNIVSNPIIDAREIIGKAWQIAGNEELLRATTFIYAQLVLHHLFNDANRRTAILATLWLTLSHGGELDGRSLADFPIGDLRESGDLERLAGKLKELTKLAKPL